MNFTYCAYEKLINSLRINGYETASYENWSKYDRCAILRHDIDYSIEKSLVMARIENKLRVKSTYFVLLTGDFYNVFSKRNSEMLCEISDMGHDLGLHFDETRYPSNNRIENRITQECDLLAEAIGKPIAIVSMHRPSKEILDRDLHLRGIINSYSKVFFKDFKYLSDSRRRWREPIDDVIASRKFDKLHILTHAFWYNEKETDLYGSVKKFVDGASSDRYRYLSENIMNLEQILQDTYYKKDNGS